MWAKTLYIYVHRLTVLHLNRLTNRNDYEAKFNPGTVPSRRGLSKASGQALHACEGVIELWDGIV